MEINVLADMKNSILFLVIIVKLILFPDAFGNLGVLCICQFASATPGHAYGEWSIFDFKIETLVMRI